MSAAVSTQPAPTPRPSRLRPVLLGAPATDPRRSILDVALPAFGFTNEGELIAAPLATAHEIAHEVTAAAIQIRDAARAEGGVALAVSTQKPLALPADRYAAQHGETSLIVAVGFSTAHSGTRSLALFRISWEGPIGAWVFDTVTQGVRSAFGDELLVLLPHGSRNEPLAARLGRVVEVGPYPESVRLQTDLGAITQAVAKRGHEYFGPAPTEPFAVASDASAHVSGEYGPACAAWVGANGRGAVFVLGRKTSPLVAELAGIHGALRSVPPQYRDAGVGVTVLSDSQHAIRAVRKARSLGVEAIPKKRVRHWVALILDEVNKLGGNVEFSWVPGHSGHPLNEAADSISRAARFDAQPDSYGTGLRPFTEREQMFAARWAEGFSDTRGTAS